MKKNFSADVQIALIFLSLALTLGATMRLFPIFRADFPLADGGMFYAMARDLLAANFALPEVTSYNRSAIPFAYPPLGFYLAAALHAFAGVPLLEVLRWLPFAFSLLNIPLVYLFARELCDSEAKAALAVFLFALVPGSYWWNIVGGGLTRAPGAFFFSLAALSMLKMYRTESLRWLAAAVLSVSAVTLSHPAWTLETVLAALALWYFFGRNWRGFLLSLALAAGALALTAPWWGVVFYRHGWQAFLYAAQNAYTRLQAFAMLVMLSFTSERVPVFALFGMTGLFIHLAQKKYFLPAWVALCFFVEPRSGAGASLLPFSILAADALADGIAARLSAAVPPPIAWSEAVRYHRGRLFFGFLTLFLSYNAFQMSDMISRRVLGAEERAALEWAALHTSPESRFLVLDEVDNPVYSPLTEWFPALAERRSVATIQGTEWLGGERNFTRVFPFVKEAHECFTRDAVCLDQIRAGPLDDFEYVLLSVKMERNPLLDSLRGSEAFTPVYSSATTYIFRVGRNP